MTLCLENPPKKKKKLMEQKVHDHLMEAVSILKQQFLVDLVG